MPSETCDEIAYPFSTKRLALRPFADFQMQSWDRVKGDLTGKGIRNAYCSFTPSAKPIGKFATHERETILSLAASHGAEDASPMQHPRGVSVA